MADFLDSEAEESDEEQELNATERKKLKKLKALDSDDEEDEEDDEERIREELKDLIDDNPIEEEESDDGGDSDVGGSKKRKKSDDEDEYDDRLEDDDYELLEENLGVKMERRKQFKRLRRIEDEESDEEQTEQNEGDERDAIANELFDHSDHLDHDEMDEDRSSDRATQQRSEADRYDEEGSEGEYSDADDFIVDDDGRPIAEKRKRRKPIFTDAALQEAQDIFGVDFDYDEFSKYDDYEEESEEDDEYIDEEEGEEGRKRREKKATRKKKPTRKSIFEIYEPSELKRGHFTDVDNEIRTTDLPERMQLRAVPVTKAAKDSPELEAEAEWVYKQAFCKNTISTQDGFGSGETSRDRAKKGPQTVNKIKCALDHMRNEHFEVPFIAFYRKEYVQPELNINDLWKVYKYDEKWCQLQSRKTNLTRLFEKMRDYQAEQLMKNIDQPIADNVRVVKDEDIDRLKKVQTMEELRDIYQHFMLYYSHEMPAMQESYRRKERAEAREQRRQERLARRAERGDGEEGAEDEEVVEEEPPEDEDAQHETETLKQASRGGTYALCRKAALDGLAKKFGLSPEQFAENLRDNYQRHEVEQEPAEPSVVAEEYKSNIFKTADDILMAAKYMVAIQLSREPLVRSCMRETYFERANITIKPTKKGVKEIDENHPCYSMKYVKNKPVRDLSGDQYLKLHMAEQERLITITICEDIEGMTSSSYLEEIKQLYIKDEFSKSVTAWNNLRMESVELALKKLLMPSLRTELRERLLAEAKDSVLRMCCRKLYNWLKVAPYSAEFAEEDEDDWDTSKGLRVLSIAYVPDFTQAAFACLVGPEGECLEFIRLPNLLKRKNGWREEDKLLKEADLLALRHLITSKKPHVVCIGAESREATMLQADLKEIVAQVVEDEQFPSIAVEICDNELSKVYANSIKGTNDFRDYPHLLRQAISLARRMQDPLIEFSQLCSADEEILCLRFHPLQEQITKEELLDALYLEFVNRTNEVGVDLNRAIQEPNTSYLVQFVCGLGPRKGAALLKALKQSNQRLENRTQLVTICHMAPVVFINCAGFIRIDTNSLGDSTETYVEVLDGSRVHPETYEWARKMAVDALEYDDEDANPAGALEEILDSPERLKDLDLDAFAEELERQNFGDRSITLYDIRSELTNRYKDLRSKFQSANPEELFDMLTKENPETFFIGKLIMATVAGITHRKPQGDQLDQANPVRNDETGLWQCPFCLKNDFPELSEVWNHFDAGGCPGQATGVRLRLDNGISGYIPIKALSDNHVTNPEERVRIGQIIHCRVVKIEVDRFSVECTSRSSDLADKNATWRPPKDPFYDNEAEEADLRSEEESKKMKQRQTYVKRVIVHPSFHNISYTEAEKMMANMDQGDVIVRPSSKGSSHLTVTWKVADNIYQHIDVKETGKENAFSLGQSLWIDNLEFEDLDEIIARHVTPMAGLVRDVLSFKYHRDFEGGKREKAEAALQEEREKNKTKIHYFISTSKEFPGKFLLSYMPRNRPRHEYLTVTPEGFRYRRQMFDSLSGLMRWFKEHFRDPVPGTPSTPRGSMTNRTPFTNHTPTMNMSSMNAEAIQRVAQSMPSHMLHSLSQVANQTPHYPHTPGGPGFTGAPGYGAFANTPYTPSGQTPYMTPYQTPHTQQTPRYGQQTPSHSGGFLHPGAVTPGHRTPSHSRPSSQQGSSSRPHGSTPTQHGTPQYRSSTGPPPPNTENTDWKKAAEEWAKLKQREPGWATPRSSDGRNTPRERGTPRYDEGRGTPRSYDGRSSRGPLDTRSPRIGTPKMGTPRMGTPRSTSGRESVRSTPRTNTSPHSMVESSLGGDATPLYDEN